MPKLRALAIDLRCLAPSMTPYDALDYHVGPDPEMVDYLTSLRARRPMFARVIFLTLWADAMLHDHTSSRKNARP